MTSKLGNKCPRTRRCVYAECRAAKKAQRTSQGRDGDDPPQDRAGDAPCGECGCGDASRQEDRGLLIAGQTARSDSRTEDHRDGIARVGATKHYDAPDSSPVPRHDRKILVNGDSEDANLVPDSSQPSHIAPPSYDEPDKPPEPCYSWLDIVFCLISIVSYLADVGTDCWLVYLYYTHNTWWYFGLTLAFIIIPGLTVTIFSLAWYIEDHKQDKSKAEDELKQPVHPVHWVSRVMLLFLQLGPVMRYIESLIYGLWSKKADSQDNKRTKELWYKMMLYEDTDSCLLRLIECFMESAPQLVLQLYILTTYGKQIGSNNSMILVVGQSVSCVTALGSLSWALASYHKALRCSLENKANISYKGMAMQFLWRFFTIGSRVLAMALFASAFGYFVFVAAAGHWFIMLFWILILDTKFCTTKCQEIFFNMVMAAVYIFCYLNLKEGHTRLRYIFYYSLIYLENVGLLLGWYFFSNTNDSWHVKLSMVIVLLGFFIGLLFQGLFYMLCHPNNAPPWDQKARIRLCVPCSVLWPTLCNSPGRLKMNARQKRRESLGSLQEMEVFKQGSTIFNNKPHDQTDARGTDTV